MWIEPPFSSMFYSAYELSTAGRFGMAAVINTAIMSFCFIDILKSPHMAVVMKFDFAF
jgi:hypothetical protein